MDQLPAVINEAMVDLNTTLPRLIKGQEIGINLLKDITKVTKETRQGVIDAMAENRKVTEKLNGLRSPITKKLDELKASLMQYEKGTGGEYERVKGLVTAFDNIELEIARKAQAKAARELEITTYKASLKESIGKAVIGMVGGQVRTVIEGMAKWEAALTLENIDKKAAELQTRQLQLKREKYDECFVTNFVGKRTDLLTEEEFTAFMESMKKEYSYEKANEDYLQQTSPIINEYRAKIVTIKEELSKIKAKPELQADRQKEIENKSWEALKANEQATNAKVEEVKNEKDRNVMEAEFVRQGTLEGMDVPAVKYIPEFEDINLNKWVKPFLEIVAKCAVHPKFKLVKEKKPEYIDAVQWWLNFYGANFKEKLPGIVMKEEAKTVIRAKKEEF